MKRAGIELSIISAGLLPSLAGAQELSSSSASPSVSGAHGIVAAALVVAATMLVMLAIAKLNDLRIRRQERLLDLEAHVRDALLECRELGRVHVWPVVRASSWNGGPLTVELYGKVPSAQLENVACRIAADVAARRGAEARIENRMSGKLAPEKRAEAPRGEMPMAGRFVNAMKSVGPVVGMLVAVALVRLAMVVEQLHF